MKKLLRKLHRWLGVLMALQIIAWMASGLYFSLIPIEEIRGEHLTVPAKPLQRSDLLTAGSPDGVQRALDTHFGPGWELSGAQLVASSDRALWRVEGQAGEQPFTRLVDAGNERVLPMLTAADAQRTAGARLKAPAPADDVEWVETVPPGAEMRGRSPPLWKVSFAGPDALTLYLDPWTGELMARRTTQWRWFDFFWMLHIMDFEAREDFNHPLLQIAALLGLVVALSGLIFWLMTTRLFRRRAPQL
jgi:uncharacterized iron-regulated membrane protein